MSVARNYKKQTQWEEEPQAEEEPMTSLQASCLQTLSEEAGEPQAYEVPLSRREAAKRIAELKDRLGLLDPPPHTD